MDCMMRWREIKIISKYMWFCFNKQKIKFYTICMHVLIVNVFFVGSGGTSMMVMSIAENKHIICVNPK